MKRGRGSRDTNSASEEGGEESFELRLHIKERLYLSLFLTCVSTVERCRMTSVTLV